MLPSGIRAIASWKPRTRDDTVSGSWIGQKGSEFPASVTTLSEAAEPVDVATGLNGGGAEGAGGSEGAVADEPAAAGGGDSSDMIARIGAGVAAALGLGALAAVLVGRRRERTA